MLRNLDPSGLRVYQLEQIVQGALYGPPMTEQTWRLDPIGGRGNLAWLYLRAHRVTWDIPSTATEAAGYTITEERQALVDDQLDACIRYLAIRPR